MIERRSASARQPGSMTVVALRSRMIAGPAIASPRPQCVALVERRVVPAAVEEHRRLVVDAVGRAQRDSRCGLKRDVAAIHRASRRPPRPRSPRRPARVPGIRKPKLRAVLRRRNVGRQRRRVASAQRQLQACVGAVVLQRSVRSIAIALARDALRARRFAAPRARASRTALAAPSSVASSSAASTARCRITAHVGEAHAVGRQHAGQRMDEHASHAERVGDQARVLAAGAAEAATACTR